MLYRHAGLLGASGLSADARDRLASAEPAAREALDRFAFRIAREVAATACTLGLTRSPSPSGSASTDRRPVPSSRSGSLGPASRSTPGANDGNALRIEAPEARVAMLAIPTDEEQVIAAEAIAAPRLLGAPCDDRSCTIPR